MLIILGAAALFAARGAFAAVTTFLATLIAWLLTVNYYTLVQRLLLMIHRDTYIYSDGAALLFTYFLSFLLLQYLAISFLEEHIQLNAAVSGLAGALFGGMTGLILAGVLVIAWFMMPAAVHYRRPDQKEPPVTMNVDEKILTVARFMANDRIKGAVAFDPGHTFMRTHTLKYVAPPEEEKETSFAEEMERRRLELEAEDRRRLNLTREPEVEDLDQ